MNELIELFQRQVDFVLRQHGQRLLLALPRLITFAGEEPRISAICADLLLEFKRETEALADAERAHAEEIRVAWARDGDWFTELWVDEGRKHPGNPAFHEEAFGGDPKKLTAMLERAGRYDLDRYEEPQEDSGCVGIVLRCFSHWRACLKDRTFDGEEAVRLQRLTDSITLCESGSYEPRGGF
jgi:hypothetical protein